MTRFATLLQETVETEMNLHRAYAAEFEISREQLEREPAAPTTRGYTDFLLRAAATGDFAELVAALLPCMWAFSEIGQRLAAQPAPRDKRYDKWIAMYSSGEFSNWPSGAVTCLIVSPQVCPSVRYKSSRPRFSPAAAMSGSSGRWLGRWSAWQI